MAKLSANSKEKVLQAKLSRRRFLGMGVLATLFLAGAPVGKLMGKEYEEDTESISKANHRPEPIKWLDKDITVAWLGHASFLINFYGTKILIDPALETRIGLTPVGNYTVGPKRYVEPALSAEDLGPVDLLLLSHAHTDHFDLPTIKKIESSNTHIITAKNTASLLEGTDFASIKELHWQESADIAGVTIEAIEGQHWGARLPWQKGMDANSLLLSKNGVNIFFGADTGYTTKISEQLRNVDIDLAIMGIAAYSPKAFENKHATPEQAWQMAEEMKAKWVAPMHWGTFKLSKEPMDEPIKRFRSVSAGQAEKVAIQEVGGTWVRPGT
ncbi:MAG: MBL fold metallo-hydrolase [Desulfosporosinus sp.]|jgi:L-ascorbate metabolism protein UlaG (beta-lactamase superfamily)